MKKGGILHKIGVSFVLIAIYVVCLILLPVKLFERQIDRVLTNRRLNKERKEESEKV